ncbi:hypothetical protein [Actinomadura sp. NPDC000929]|uniref:hypothetical protein n=1 Tax=Actinomadura sp. NPDC000929 TaxID=3154517 RepID=UPI00339255BC
MHRPSGLPVKRGSRPGEVREAVDTGTVPDDRITMKASLERWVSVNPPGTLAKSTEDDYADMVRLHLVPTLGCKKLTVAKVDRLWNSERPDTPQTPEENSGRKTRIVCSAS